MSTEQNKAAVRDHYASYDERDLDAATALWADDLKVHGLGPQPLDKLAFKQMLLMFSTAFPDGRHTLEVELAEADKVAVYWTFRGTHRGELMGIPATGKRITITGIAIDRFAQGKIAEHWVSFDQMGLMQQLGVIPTPEQAGN
jgi:steroid delta-isomerase-like uncharacterized protein